jgi:hypothetical protein
MRYRTVLLTAGALAAAVMSTVPATADAVPGVSGPDGVALTLPITGTSPDWAVNTRRVGLAPPDEHRHLTVFLDVKNRDHLEAAASRVDGWLRRGGLRPGPVRCGGRIDVDGTTATINSIFHTQLGRFRISKHELHVAPITDVLIPGELKTIISTVVGLSDLPVAPDISPMLRIDIPPSAVECDDEQGLATAAAPRIGASAFPPHASDNY